MMWKSVYVVRAKGSHLANGVKACSGCVSTHTCIHVYGRRVCIEDEQCSLNMQTFPLYTANVTDHLNYNVFTLASIFTANIPHRSLIAELLLSICAWHRIEKHICARHVLAFH